MTPRLYSPSFILMGAANLFTVSSFACFFLFPIFITDHGGTKADIGVIMGVFSLSSVLCRPWISEMIDRIGRKRSYTIGCLIMTVLPLLYLLFKGNLINFYIPLIFIRFLHGIGLAICFTSVFTYIADIIPKTRLNEGIGMFGVTGLIGMAVGPVIAEIAINEFGFTCFFVVSSLLGAAGLLLHLPLPESYIPSFIPSSNNFSHSFFSVLKKRKVFMVALLSFSFGFVLAASGNFVAPFAKEQGLTFISIYYISYSMAAVITRLVGGRLADRVGEERVIPYAAIITCAGILVLMLLGGTMILIVSGLLSGCGHGFLFPCLNSVVIRNEPIGIRGKITGVFTGAIDMGAFTGSVLLGYIGEWMGFRAIFLAAGVMLLIGLCVYRPHKHPL